MATSLQGAEPSSNPTRGSLVRLCDLFKPDVQDGIFLPILVVEMPPLLGIDRETFLLHGLAEDGAALALFGRAAGVVGVRALAHLVIAAGHLHGGPGLKIVESQVYRASAIMPGTFSGIGQKELLVV